MFRLSYCVPYNPDQKSAYTEICQEFVSAAQAFSVDLMQKPKFHLLLHLSECIHNFGPTSAYNTERYIAIWLIMIILLILFKMYALLDVNV